MKHTLGIAELYTTTNPQDEINHAAHSDLCLGVTIFDPDASVGGMLHALLPLSKTDTAKSTRKPRNVHRHRNARTTKPNIQTRWTEKKSNSQNRGGMCFSTRYSEVNSKIGERNYAVLRKILWLKQYSNSRRRCRRKKTKNAFTQYAKTAKRQ